MPTLKTILVIVLYAVKGIGNIYIYITILAPKGTNFFRREKNITLFINSDERLPN